MEENNMKVIFKLAMDSITTLENSINKLNGYVEKEIKETVKKNKNALIISQYFKWLDSEDSLTEEEKIKYEKYKNISENLIKIEENSENIIYYTHKKGKPQINVQKSEEEVLQSYNMRVVWNNSIIINLMIFFENFVSKIFAFCITTYPQAYFGEKTNISGKIIFGLSSIEELRSAIIDKEINKIMHQGIDDWFKVLSEKHKIKIDFEDNTYEKFKEVYYRRNLIVHNNSKVNQEYLNNISDSLSKPKINTDLKTDYEYVINAIEVTKKVIIELLYNMDLSLCNENTELIDEFEKYAFECMLENKWKIGSYIYSLLMKDKRYNNQQHSYAKVNYWQCLKRNGEFENIQEEIKKWDVSDSKDIYKLAKLILLEDNEAALELLERVYVPNSFQESTEDRITSQDLKEWPLFMEFRNSEEYNTFKEKHKIDFIDNDQFLKENDEIIKLIDDLEVLN